MSAGTGRPPAAAQWALRLLMPARHYEELAGDLHELFLDRAERDGVVAARRWYWRQLALAFMDAKPVRRPVISQRIVGDPLMKTIAQDARYAVRMLIKQPAFTTVAVLMLALGIGANATIFSWVNSVLLNPLPGAARSDELVQLAYLVRGTPLTSFSYPDYRDIRDRARTLSGVAGRDDLAVGVVIDREAERAWGELVTGNFFDVLGVRAWRGRVLQPSDDAPGAGAVAVISHTYWVSRFGASDAVVGRQVEINAQPFTIVGVAPPGFQGGESGLQFDLWVPMGTQPIVVPGGERRDVRGSRWLSVLARRVPGAPLESVRAEMAALVAQIAAEHPGYENHSAGAYPLSESPTGGVSVLRPVLIVLMVVAGIVLLIACLNLAGLLLARAAARQREMAIRLSIGAGRARLVQQLLVEGVLLAIAGTAAAVLALRWTAGLLMSFAPPSELPIHLAVAIDGRVVGFTALVALGTVLLFALVPALQVTTSNLVTGLRDGGPGGAAFGRHRLRRGLVAAQVALSITLMVGAGLCVRSLWVARVLTPGFSADGVIVGWVDLFAAGYTTEAGRAFYPRLLDRVRALPGVESVSAASRIPLGFIGGSFSNVTVEGHDPKPDDPASVGVNRVGPDYFRTLGIPLVAGRDFTGADVNGQPRVAVISEAMARAFWPGRNAIGGRFIFGRMMADRPADFITVVGVARDVKQRAMNERPQPFLYIPLLQFHQTSTILHVRTAGDPAGVMASLPRAVREIDPGVPFYNVALLSEHTAAATFQQKLAANLLVVFGALALLLAAVGSYGVLSYLVGQRRREIGIRMAIGATRASVFRLVVSNGARLVAAGAVAGFLLSIGVGFGLRGLLIGVEPIDPLTYATVFVLLVGVAIAACALPARRAATLDPLSTLRED
jgi:predicted permease